ncbi:diguanylate cyclase [Novimethylophilus kurashikiensis]|uniref:Diguanylate cyclase n=1 Tax=Novimethylophilus kurashikiensis TaxID=1825523 RepID=A0A2R5FB20_9PROT|nr:EAL domain-containing protein [Novimethylophilus kurashikiensis]GBG15426.1 diguanylate cyclase [Novimethylophilus kurashikiensis]
MLQDLVAQVSDCTGEALYANALDWLQKWLKADICFIGETDQQHNIIRAIRGDSRRQLQVGTQYELVNSPCERAIRQGFHYVPAKVAEAHPLYPSLRALNIEGYAGVPLRDKHGQLLGMLVMLSHGELQLPDYALNLLRILAARISGEMARIRADATRQESEFFSRAVLDAMPADVCVLDHRGVIIAANQRWKQLSTLLEGDEICGTGRHYLNDCLAASRLHEGDAAALRSGTELLLSGRRDTFRHEFECPVTRRWFLLIASRFSQGRQSYIVLTQLDITDRKQAEAHLENRSVILDGMISSDWLLHSMEPWHKVMPEVLNMIGKATDVERVYLYRHESVRAALQHVWQTQAPEELLQPPYGDIRYDDDGCRRWAETLSHGQAIFGELTEFPETEQQLLRQHGSCMLTLIPVFSGDEWWGFIALESCTVPREMSPHELSALMAAGRSLGVAIQRESANKRLTQAMIAFDSIAEGVVITDDKAVITAINKGFTEITGYTEDDILGHPIYRLRSDEHGKEFYHAIWHVVIQEGRWRGEVWNRRKDGSAFPGWLTITEVADADGNAINYVAVFSDVSEVRQVENRLQELVNHDPLTGLPNRRLLNELMGHAIKRAEREQSMIGVLFIDLDRFKTINDSLGHQMGDKLLVEVASRLRSAMRESDAVARLGGDEFVVMVDDLRDIEDARLIAQKIIASLHQEFIIEGKEFFIGASIGISVYPNHGREVDDLLKAADIAMYQVKNQGKNGYLFYTAELSENAVERFTLESTLRRALEREQFELYYQPQVSLSTGRIIGAEALIRWHHPELGLVSPAKFIPLAEESDLIIQIGEWVLREAATQAKRWAAAGYALEWISVNVSGVQIQRSNFVDTVYGVLIETDCDPSLLELEITESTIMRNTEHVIGMLDHIKALGLRLAIDDFGTGYSSLSHLKRLPLHKLKIDQSFVHDLPHDTDDAAIARVIRGLGNSLGLSVIAEGVETQEQAEFLLSIGCDEGQGYLYSPPVSATAFTALLENDKLKQQ